MPFVDLNIRRYSWYTLQQLGRLSLKAQQIRGSLAIGMLSSSAELQKQLSTVLKLFNQNASALFPREIKGVSSRRFFKSRVLMDEDTASSHIDFDETTSATFDRFPEHLQELVESLSTLYTCLNDFSDVTAEALDVLIPSLIGDLTVRSFIHRRGVANTATVLGIGLG